MAVQTTQANLDKYVSQGGKLLPGGKVQLGTLIYELAPAPVQTDPAASISIPQDPLMSPGRTVNGFGHTQYTTEPGIGYQAYQAMIDSMGAGTQQAAIDSATARYIADQQLKLGQQQFDLGADLALAQEGRAGEQYQRYKDMYLPNEEEFAAQSRYGTPTGLAAHRAGAGVTQQMNRARGQMAQQLAARGITPGSPAYANAMRQVDIAEATGRAGAMDAASNQERSLNFAKKQNLVNIGRGMPSEVSAMAATATPLVNNAAQYYGQAGQGVANAANISQGATGQALSGYQTGLSALQNASSGARDWWNMQQNAANQRGQLEQGWAKLNQQQTDSSGWGGLLGTLATKIPW